MIVLKRILLTIPFFFLLNSFAQDLDCKVIPTPLHFSAQDGYLQLGSKVGVDWSDVSSSIQEQASTKLNVLFGIQTVNASPLVVFIKDESISNEGYQISIDSLIEINYSSDAGAFYALTTLYQLIEAGQGIRVPKITIKDVPEFKWRGLHLDVSRHFFNVDEVKRYIDLMALYKFNTFHWHLTDDQGWRIEIKKYPRLTEIGGFRDSTMIGHFSDQPRKYNVQKYGGFYTQEEIKEVVAYAAERFITVVPEIEMPGHSRAAIHAYPELSCTGVSKGIPGEWGIFDEIFCSKEETILFLQDVLSEVLELFPSEYIHVGGDEAPKSSWKSCSTCQANIVKYNLKDEHGLQSYFIQQMDQYLTSKGRKLIGWDEILEGGLSENASVMSWRGESGGIEAAKQSHNVVMSPTTYCYFDYYQSTHREEPIAIGGYLPLEKVYGFNVIPDELNEEFTKFIVGGQANLWTEYVSDFSHVEYMVYPRALALAQNLWCKKKPSYADFLKTVITKQEEYMSQNRINYAPSIHYPEMLVKRDPRGLALGFQEADKDAEFSIHAINQSVHFVWSTDLKGGETFIVPRDFGGDLLISVEPSTVKDTFHFQMTQHGNLGIKCETDPAPHPKYDHNGSLNLVDGVYGSLPWKGGDWLGFNSSDVTLTFDLEKRERMEGVRIGFLDIPGAWIYLPHTIDVLISSNGVDWKKTGTSKILSKDLQDGVITLNKMIDSRYVRLIIHNLKEIPEGAQGAGNVPWTFIDEVEFKILYE